MAGIPGVTIEVAWTNDPLTRPGLTIDTLLTEGGDTLVTEGGDTLTTEGTWTDITAGNPARDTLTTARGVDMKLGSFKTGVMNLTLDNVNGDLDPSNTSSTYSPNVKPRKRIRASITPDGGTKTVIFTGFVERWPIRWRVEDEVVQVAASDLFGVIAEEILPPSVVHHEIVGTSPTHYWPMNESGQFYIADDVVGAADGRWFSQAQGEALSLPPYDSQPANHCTLGSSDGTTPAQRVSMPVSFGEDDPPVGLWYQLGEKGTSVGSGGYVMLWSIVSNDSNHSVRMIFEPDAGTLKRTYVGASGSTTLLWDDPGLADGDPHYLYWDPANVVLYMDGVALPAPGSSSGGTPTTAVLDNATLTIGGAPGATITLEATPWKHVITHVSTWTEATTVDHAAIYDAGVNAWDGDTTSARLIRVLDIVGVDALDRDIETGTQLCGPALLNSENVVTYIRKIAATESSALFVSADGKVTFRANDNDPAAVLVFGEDVAGSEVPYSELVPDFPVERIINLAEVNRDGGNIQSHDDATSRTENGTTSVQVQTLHQTPSGARSLAAGLVARNKTPKTTITRLTVDGRDDAVTAAASLDLEIGDGVDARLAPPHVDIFLRDGAGEILLDGNGDALTTADGIARYHVERVEQRVSDDAEWEVTYGLAEVTVLPDFAWDTADQGWNEAVWS